jgi:O-antigen ligase
MSTLRQYSTGVNTALLSFFSLTNIRRLAFLWTPVFLVSAFFGLCCAFLPWWLNLAAAGGALYIALLCLFPWAGFGAYVLLTIVSPDFKIADAATVGTMVILWARLWTGNRPAPAFPPRLKWPLLIFGGIVVVSFCLAVGHFHNSVPNIYRDGRAFLYWLWIPLLWRMAAGASGGVQKLTYVMLGTAVSVSLIAIFQAFTGVQVVAVGLVAALDQSAGAGSLGSITRVQMGGYSFVSWAVIWLTLQVLYKRVNIVIGGGLMLVLAVALYVNFGRGLWVWTFLGILMSVFFIGAGRAAKLFAALLVAGLIGAGGLAAIKPTVLENVANRLVSVKDEGGKKTSYGWRELENQDAVAKLSQVPVFGVGVGGEYRAWIHDLRLFVDHVRYIHNSYLFVALKLGIPGLLCLLLVFWRAWNGGRRGWPAVAEQNRVALLSCLIFLPVYLGLSITQPEFMVTYSILLFGMLLLILMNSFPPHGEVIRPLRKGSSQ